MKPLKITSWDDLADREPLGAMVEGADVVVVRCDDDVSVLYGRCLHRGALMADGTISGDNLVCGVHGWDPRQEIADELVALGALVEWSSVNLLAVDAADAAQAQRVADFLLGHEQVGHFVYETGRSV